MKPTNPIPAADPDSQRPWRPRFIQHILGWTCTLLVLMHAASTLAVAPAGYQLLWSDEFDGTALDPAKWKHHWSGQRRDALNAPDAVSVEDGFLVISTFTEDGIHRTGMISTEGLFEARYGYWEAAIQFQDAPGTFSDFWIHSPTIGEPHDNVALAGVEVDVIEHRTVDNAGNDLSGKSSMNLHWGGYDIYHDGDGDLTPDLQLGTGFHVYGFEWTEAAYRFYIDGRLVWSHHKSISQRTQYAIFSTEVESELWSGRIPEEGYGDRLNTRVKMLVDYVRYYAPDPSTPSLKD